MSRPPKVSVLLPTFEYARYLPEAIRSILDQDFGDFELLISDDASGDGSAEVIRAHAGGDPRVRVKIHERNLGMVAHWNWCLAQARGEYVKFVFGDDRLVCRKTLGRMAARLDEDPQLVLASSARLVLDEDSRVTDIWSEIGATGRYRGRDIVSRALMADRNVIGEPSCVLFRRAAAARGFDPGLRQVVDLEMWCHLLMQGDLAYDADPLCSFRRHPSQQTAVNSRVHVGPTESLIVTVRYLDVLADADRTWRGRFLLRAICQRRLYYSRKHSVRTPAIKSFEAILAARVSRPWAAFLWALHRLSKPFQNLFRSVRQAAGGSGRRRTPVALAEFCSRNSISDLAARR